MIFYSHHGDRYMRLDFSKNTLENFLLLLKKSNKDIPDNFLDIVEVKKIEPITEDLSSKTLANINTDITPNTKVTFEVKDPDYAWENPILTYRRIHLGKQWELLRREGTTEDIPTLDKAKDYINRRMGIVIDDNLSITLDTTSKKIKITPTTGKINLCYIGSLDIPYGIKRG